jgi:hypothetical protein
MATTAALAVATPLTPFQKAESWSGVKLSNMGFSVWATTLEPWQELGC